jgi:2-hydroxychromene-2-carboxylate isomerase
MLAQTAASCGRKRVRVEFFFDCSSPWTYLAFHRIEAMARELEFEIAWRPILVGGVFNAINPSVYENRSNPVPAKRRYQAKDMADWARHCGLAIVWPPAIFPINSVKAMRGCLVAEAEGKLALFARAVFETYWGQDRDIADETVLREIATGVGLNAAALIAGIATPAVKDRLRANTDELIRRGGFGSPTIFVAGDDMYFGNDRIPLVREAILAGRTRS